MKAVCWQGAGHVHVADVPDPRILNPHDAIIRVTSTAICGSDLHLFDGFIPTMQAGDILGHEFMGEVVEIGAEVRKLRIGNRVVVPFTISCGQCSYCKKDLWSLCDNTNPNPRIADTLYGHSGAGLFGYSHMYGGYAGGQAEYVRVPFADVGPLVISNGLPDEDVLFLSDILPTAFMAAENCNIQEGDTVAVWGCGPVGLLTLQCARLLGAERIIAIDRISERLFKAAESSAETINYEQVDVQDRLLELTGGRGPDACVDAVGMEAHGTSLDAILDKVNAATYLATDRSTVLHQAIQACRKGGVVSIPGVYGGFLDKFPLGAAFAKGLTLKMGQTHVRRYMEPLLKQIEERRIDPSFVITHRLPLSQAPQAYRTFRDKLDACVKVVLKPGL